MKIWNSNSVEHSAKLKIIATFKSVNDAKEAAEIFNVILNCEQREGKGQLTFSEEMMEILNRYNFNPLNGKDLEQFDYFYPLETEGNKIVVDTDELEIQALMKVLLDKGAKVEVYSKHDYPEN